MLAAVTLQAVQKLIMQVAVGPAVLAGVIGLVRRRELSPALRYLLALIGLCLLTELVSRLLWWQSLPNLFLLPVYTAGELALLLLLYRQALRSTAFHRAVPWLLGGFGLYTLATSLITPDLQQFNSVQRVVESVVVLGCVGLYFRQLLNELTVEHLWREPLCWVSLGLLIYFVGDVYIFLFSNYIMQYSREFNMTVWTVHAVLYMVLYCCYSLALWLHPKN